MELLKWQKKEIFKIIESFEFDPIAQFDLAEIRFPSSVILTHKDTGYRFTFEVNLDFDDREYLRLTYSPSKVKMVYETTLGIDDWTKLQGYLRVWLDCLKRELNTDDPWKEILEQKGLPEAVTEIGKDNVPFTTEEVTFITSQLSEIKDFLIAKGLVDEEHQAIVESRLRYLEDATKKFGKKDWITLMLGEFFKLFLEKILSSTIVSQILGTLLPRIASGIRYLPPPP